MKIIIIGGVAAGMSAASKIKKTNKDAEIVVFEKGEHVSYGACGLPYYVSGQNDDLEKMVARRQEDFVKQGIDVRINHEVIKVEPEGKKVNVKNTLTNAVTTENYDKLLIATGADPIIPNIKGAELEGVYTLKTLGDGEKLHEKVKDTAVKNVIIVGGGYIGIEIVDAMHVLGKNIRCIEAASTILAPFDKEISDIAIKEIEDKGVSLHLSEMVKELAKNGESIKISTDKGVYDADCVIIAAGVRPATKFLQDSGINLAKNGAVIVDREMRTNFEDIYSAGDCSLVYNEVLEENFFSPLGTVANKCGRMVGENILGKHLKFVGALGSAAIKVLDLEMARTGMSEKDCQRLAIDYKTVMVTVNDHPGYYPDQTPIIIKLLYDAKTKRILGANAAGKKGVVLRVDMFAIAIHNKMTTEDLGMVDLCYAPPYSGVWDAVHIACQQAK